MSQMRSRIVQEAMDEPHIEGRRVSVLQIHEEVEEQEGRPATVADRYELDVSDVYRALAYYHEHPQEMASVRERRNASKQQAIKQAREQRPDNVTPSK